MKGKGWSWKLGAGLVAALAIWGCGGVEDMRSGGPEFALAASAAGGVQTSIKKKPTAARSPASP